ncbi:hypothetical protein CONPUDRAFT_156065 [Coniophora puteana RWD-64-598 SS2]|uniref:DEAD/DEAH-box helicase domain-containing protein n=1 Tax=Coniophora puteana (strain RWD-64-598) TaxID=741705 RepID=A0A5M3MJH0_CONPW|nr:uncharacterized protein CONPUDRAFT_156065 [Coniophora puteana RWD-64-598 SS2]EIW79388.1 hypothetical protein CONPUDRAFT_156065 [Coniophora puteana RWD-64-598 SS2]
MNAYNQFELSLLSDNARRSLDELTIASVEDLTTQQAEVIFKATKWFDTRYSGERTLRQFQLEALVNVLAGKNVIVRAGTGYGKTLAMILPILFGNSSKIALTISPLKLLQNSHVDEFNNYGISTIQINQDTLDDKELWKVHTSLISASSIPHIV